MEAVSRKNKRFMESLFQVFIACRIAIFSKNNTKKIALPTDQQGDFLDQRISY
jgi:hypothetical protein